MPPRLSTSELLTSLVYLEPDFDPATLTVAQLTGLLQAHAVDTRPAKGTKTGLVKLFESEIGANREKILERRTRELARSPKANGIRDGVTGQLVTGAAEEDITPPQARRTSRRSSAEPSNAGTSRRRTSRMTSAPPALKEEEPEQILEPEPTSPPARRRSKAPQEPAFSDENVFQMGSSSPDPAPESSNRRKSRPSGRRSLAPEEKGPRDSPSNPFTKMDAAAIYARQQYDAMIGAITSSDPVDEETEADMLVPQDEDVDDDEAEALIPSAISERQPLIRAKTALPFMGLFLLLIILLQYARSSYRLGYCDRGSNTNRVLDERLEQLHAGELCLERGGMDCPPIPLFPPFMQPLHCTPCPENATCAIHTLACDAPLILKRHPLSPLNPVLSGFPGFGPIAFPPSCVEDESRKKLLTNAGRWIIERLQRHRGEQICYGHEPHPSLLPHIDARSEDPALPWKWAAVKKSDVKQMMAETREGKSLGPEKLEEVFAGAMRELEERKYVLSARDEEGEEWVAALQARMSGVCKIRVWGRELWRKARVYIAALVTILVSLLYVRRQLYLRRQTTALAHSLLPAILSALQRNGHPVLSSQLRDSILAYEPNLKRRKEIWERVEKIVEMNANVRVGEEEVGGEVGRGWRWIGPPAIEDVGEGTPGRRELRY